MNNSYKTIFVAILIAQTDAMDIWPSQPIKWPREVPSTKILYQNQLVEPTMLTLDQLIHRSDNFPIAFPDNSTRCVALKNSVDKERLEDTINSAYPLIHEQALPLFVAFLAEKRRFGNKLERDLYANMTLLELIDRLLIRRAVTFVGSEDRYLLIDGSEGVGNWESVGTDVEEPPLDLHSCLSYDEIQLSALLGVSSDSFFIGGGNGVVTGAVGARLEKEKVMEYREIMKTKEQNTHEYGYGEFFVPTMQGIFTNFYGDACITYQEMLWRKEFDNTDRYIKIDEDKYFDKVVSTRRIALSIDILLVEANDRAKKQKKAADLYVVGLGLQEWKITLEQDELFVDTFRNRIKLLGDILTNINNIYFSPLKTNTIRETVPINSHPEGGINLETVQWEVENKPENHDTLPVYTYNWNGNALPGNEYWLHKLTTSDGSVMATKSQIPEIHNPHINTNIGSANLRVVTKNGLVTFKDYLEVHKDD